MSNQEQQLSGEDLENDDPEITEKDFEDMYISQCKNITEKMEGRFCIWLENRDDDFKIDIWDFRCLQDFIFSEIQSALILEHQRLYEEVGRMKKTEANKVDHRPDTAIETYHEKVAYNYGISDAQNIIKPNK